MPEYSIKDLIDAINADIEANVTLPTHGTHLYAKARALRLDEVPSWLQVYPKRTIHSMVGTESSYYDREEIVVRWTTETFTEAEFNAGDSSKAADHLDHVIGIVERLNEYGDGVPGLANVSASLNEIVYELDDGPGWDAEIELWVEVFRGG